MGSVIIPDVLKTPAAPPSPQEVERANYTLASRDAQNARQSEEARIAETTKRSLPQAVVDWAFQTYGIGKSRSVPSPSPRASSSPSLAQASSTSGRRPLGYGLDTGKVPKTRPVFEDADAFNAFVNSAPRSDASISLNLASDASSVAGNGRSRDFQRRYGDVRDFEPYIAHAAHQFGVDPHLIHAMIEQESNYNPKAVSSSGAIGLMQLIPSTARQMGVDDPYDPRQNIQGGARYIAQLLQKYHGNLDKALTAYNWGPGNVDEGDYKSMPKEARGYAPQVRRRYARIRSGQ